MQRKLQCVEQGQQHPLPVPKYSKRKEITPDASEKRDNNECQNWTEALLKNTRPGCNYHIRSMDEPETDKTLD